VTQGTRRAVALVVGWEASGRSPSVVYDQDAGGHFRFGGKVSRAKVSVYDYDRGCYLSGRLASLYDHGTGAHVQLKVERGRFEGYDFASSTHFSGRVAGTSISVYDYQTGGFHNYSV
jgi:hypothetical protein